MIFQIIPFQGFDAVRFNMSPTEVREHINGRFISFKKFESDVVPSDHIEDKGILLYYDSYAKLEAVEFATPAEPELDGVNLLGMPFELAKKALSAIGGNIEEDIDGAIARDVGLSMWVPLGKDDPDAAVESVLAFRQGYVD